MPAPLSDEQIYELLHAHFVAVLGKTGATTLGQTTLETYRRAVMLLQTGHLAAMDKGGDDNEAVKDQTQS